MTNPNIMVDGETRPMTDDEFADWTLIQNQNAMQAAMQDFSINVKSALSSTDIVVTRITEAVAMNKTTWSTADVQAYLAYREILRTLLKATTVSDLPTKPPFPANT